METLEGFFRISPTPSSPHVAASEKSVLNLSQHFTLSASQHSLLAKGLSFVPTKSSSLTARQGMAADLRFYHRRLKLASYFGPTIWDGRAKSFTAPSDWERHSSRLPLQLLQLIKEDCAAVASLAYTPDAPNLLPEEEGALGDLISTRGIVIKPADKGSAVVIMDRADYVLEALRQLEDTEYYVPLSAPL